MGFRGQHMFMDYKTMNRNPKVTGKHWQYHYWNNKKLQWWLDRANADRNIVEKILPNAVDDLIYTNTISEEEGESIKQMLKSPDKENLTMAIMCIKYHKKILRKKHRNN